MSRYLLGYGPGYYYGYCGYDYPWVVIPGGGTGSGGGGGEVVVQAEGRVVNGRGYTQVTPGRDLDRRRHRHRPVERTEQRRRVVVGRVERRFVGRLLGRRRGRRLRRPHGDAATARAMTGD